ncbi:MAG: quinolinate synthase NadA [Candidatus Thorarchaeota archaeon]|nr:quinolinate synthase NadA [Candidatus Thorarchaeota archaeon]
MADELSDIQREVLKWKEKRNALLLAHNYQPIEIQEIADFVGDSLQLARKSAEVAGYDMVIFAGVKFMAETTAVLVKDIPVYIPATEALCPLAAWLTAEKIRKRKAEYPNAPVVVYVNTTAETKAECDIICTSSNAVKVVESLGAKTVLFGPDKNLAEYVRRQTGIEIIDIEPKGHCYVHQQFDPAHILLAKEEHPDAIAIVHPECPPEVQDAADMIGSTGNMVRIVAESPEKTFIIGTEMGLVQQLQKAHPDKTIIPAFEGAICLQMKKNSLEKILHVLKDLPEENIVTVPEHLQEKIKQVLERMTVVKI